MTSTPQDLCELARCHSRWKLEDGRWCGISLVRGAGGCVGMGREFQWFPNFLLWEWMLSTRETIHSPAVLQIQTVFGSPLGKWEGSALDSHMRLRSHRLMHHKTHRAIGNTDSNQVKSSQLWTFPASLSIVIHLLILHHHVAWASRRAVAPMPWISNFLVASGQESRWMHRSPWKSGGSNGTRRVPLLEGGEVADFSMGKNWWEKVLEIFWGWWTEIYWSWIPLRH